MLTKLHLQQFKSFKDAELSLGPFTLLVGANATGKSNIRDALRFLHGISRGYFLAEIIGEKYVEGGVLQWRGIRGGVKEVTFQGWDTFALEVSFPIEYKTRLQEAIYKIELVNLNTINAPPQVFAEQLELEEEGVVFKTDPIRDARRTDLAVRYNLGRSEDGWPISFPRYQPLLSQLISTQSLQIPPLDVREISEASLSSLKDMRFLDLDPETIRLPSYPGQIILGDRGENLSSVLFDICQDSQRKKALLQWVQALTPMDAVDLEFPSDFTGKILLRLVESSGQKTTAYSASDGTLQFLAMLAALLGNQPAKLYFFEELDNGIHPTRLHLLVQLIEYAVKERNIQVIATTHSPQLLRLLNSESLEYASLTYRLPDQPDTKIQRIMDISDAKQLIEKQDLARLHESGWLEDAVAFLESEELSA